MDKRKKCFLEQMFSILWTNVQKIENINQRNIHKKEIGPLSIIATKKFTFINKCICVACGLPDRLKDKKSID